MAAPTRYSLSYDFTAFQSANPTDPLPADKIEIEFNNLETTTDEIITNLGLIQRSDGALANNSVGNDQLKSEVTIGVNAAAAWLTGTLYAANDTVYQSNKVYRCLVAHTSDTFSTDLAAGKWTEILDFAQFITACQTAETNAETAETNAETAETNAEAAQVAAEAAKTNAEAAQVAAEAARDEAVAASGAVKVSANDTTAGNLEAKLLVGTGLSLSTQNDGGNETRTITPSIASQVEAEAGTVANKLMTPERTKQAIINLVYPVGSYYFSDVSTSPATVLGVGTWVAVEGVMLIGADGTYTAGSTGGSATTTQTTTTMAAHTHTPKLTNSGSAGANYASADGLGDAGTVNGLAGNTTGSGSAMNTISPYRAVYIWRRTA